MLPGDGWNGKKMFDLYVHDYMIRKKMFKAAEVFKNEAQVADDDILLTSTDGFMSDWWSIFSDVYASREAKLKEAEENLTAQATQMAPPQMDPGRSPMNTDSFDMMMANPTACLATAKNFEAECQNTRKFDPNIRMRDICAMPPPNMAGPSSSHFQQMNSNERPPMIRRENREGIVWGKTPLIHPALIGGPNPNVPLRRNGPPSPGLIQGVNQIQLQGLPFGVANQLPCHLSDQVLNSFPQVPQQQIQTTTQTQQGPFAPLVSSELGQSVQSFYKMSNDLIGSNRVEPKYNVMDARMAVHSKQATENAQRGEEIQPQLQELDRNERKRKTSSIATNGDHISGNNNTEENKCIDENIDTFLSQDEDDGDDSSAPFGTLPRRSSGRSSQDKGFTFDQIGRLHSSQSKVLCCHFSSGGNLLASAGHDKKVWICNVGTFDVTSTSEGHSQLISDVRFRPNSTFLATSSFDKSIQTWDANRLSKPLVRLLGHNEQVTSLDFHPRKTNYLCSCDSNDEIRLWNINQSTCTRVFKGANRQVRFQPNTGDLLAGAQGNVINLIDIETGELQLDLKGHTKDIRSLCWDMSGKYIASVSEDSARIWSVASGNCIHGLYSDGNNFQSCTFHPGYLLMLVIGGYQNLQLWNPTESSKTMTVEAHEGFVAALADSPQNELIASASHDQWVKLWK